MRCNMFMPIVGVAFCVVPVLARPNTAEISVFAIDDVSEKPISNASVKVWFDMDIGWRAWSDPTPIVTAEGKTDAHGVLKLIGETNTGHLSCRVWKDGFYYGSHASQQYRSKNLFGVWQPDNLVATIRLQRVERPIPLTVKRVEWRDWRRGLRGLQGTNAVMRFDMLKGDWLPPYGSGETADLTIESKIVVTGSGRLRKLYPDFGWTSMDFYEVRNEIVLSDLDAISEVPTNPRDGMKIREAFPNPGGKAVSRVFGRRQVFGRNGRDWQTKRISDYDRDRCYVFRIRSRRDEKGNLVEAYYGKIYGDFEFSGDLERGVTDVCFLYYLNPTPLDRNLEWDRKNNLCPTPGNLVKRLP